MRYTFVDCRWELGSPGRGRDWYLAGHVPGAAFLDVEADLSDPSVPDAGRHPLPSAEAFAAAASRAGIGPNGVAVHEAVEKERGACRRRVGGRDVIGGGEVVDRGDSAKQAADVVAHVGGDR